MRNRRFLRAYDPPANINQRLVFSPGLEDRAYSMNKGAGKQMRPVEDVHFSIPNQGVSDPDIVTSRDIREPSEVQVTLVLSLLFMTQDLLGDQVNKSIGNVINRQFRLALQGRRQESEDPIESIRERRTSTRTT